MYPLFATGVVYTDGKFAAGVVDTGANLPPASLTTVANLPLVSLTRQKVSLPCPFNILYCTICVYVQFYTIHIVIIICNKISVEILRHECKERTTIIWRIYANIYGVIKKHAPELYYGINNTLLTIQEKERFIILE